MSLELQALSDLSLERILAGRRSVRRTLRNQPELHPLRIAMLGGSTTQELVDFLEIALLASGYDPVFYQSCFGGYAQEALFNTEALAAFRPDLVYLHTSLGNIESFPPAAATEADLEHTLASELDRFRQIWTSLSDHVGCQIVQNNFELPPYSSLGSLDAVLPSGRGRFVAELNLRFAREAATMPHLAVHDLCSLSARFGLGRWFAPERYFTYKITTSPEASYALAQSLAASLRALFGRTRKVLVLDLDNTVWGGVIGEDGVEGLQLGHETPLAEAYTSFGQYCLALREQGILLAVCSKNDDATARAAFSHPDAVLHLHHFAAFKANWRPKHENLLEIAAELNLSTDSFVFVDDSPVERALVRAQIPGILVPELPQDPAAFPAAIEALHPFHQATYSAEDRSRADRYSAQVERSAQRSVYASYDAYLDSLEMTADIQPVTPVYLERITQLINKTNQFNLTTRRYTFAELQSALSNPAQLALSVRLSDRFGENGIISVVLGMRAGTTLDLQLWVMSCRVLKRDVECAVLDALAEQARALGLQTLTGLYKPTRRNTIVADLYPRLGFELEEALPDGSTRYTLSLAKYRPRNTHIRLTENLLQVTS